MIGSTFFVCRDPKVLAAALATDPLGLRDEQPHVDLDALVSLDFSVWLPPAIRWSPAEPERFDEEAGLAIARVEPAALAYVLDHEPPSELDEVQRADLDRLRRFVTEHGADAVYELSTF